MTLTLDIYEYGYLYLVTIHDRERALISEFFQKTDPPRLFTVRLVQHCAAVSATAELLFMLMSRAILICLSVSCLTPLRYLQIV